MAHPLTEDQKLTIQKVLLSGRSQEDAAAAAGCARRTVTEYRAELGIPSSRGGMTKRAPDGSPSYRCSGCGELGHSRASAKCANNRGKRKPARRREESQARATVDGVGYSVQLRATRPLAELPPWRRALVTENLGLLGYFANLIAETTNRNTGNGRRVDPNDLYQEGFVGLLHAAETYDPDNHGAKQQDDKQGDGEGNGEGSKQDGKPARARNPATPGRNERGRAARAVEADAPRRATRFSTWAAWWIKHVMRRFIQNCAADVRIPIWADDARRRRRKLEWIQDCVDAAGGPDTPTGRALLARISPTASDGKKIDFALLSTQLSFDAPLPSPALSGTATIQTLHDLVSSDVVDPLDAIAERRRIDQIGEALDSLNEREREMLRRRFGIDCREETLQEVGDRFGVSRERVRQIENKALRSLRLYYDEDADADVEELCA